MLSPHARLRRKDDEIVAKVMDGEAVIINLTNGLYYSTDQVGGTIWAMVEDGRSVAEIVAAVVARYDVADLRARDDALRFAAELLQHELIAVDDGEPAEPTSPPVAAGGADRLSYVSPQLSVYSDMEDLLALDPPTPGFADIPWKE